MSTDLTSFRRAKYTCYYTYLALSPVFVLPPMLFLTFRQMYGISYTLLGSLVLVNFTTQLIVDLIFTFFTKYFHIHKTIRIMPLLTSAGMMLYALIPTLVPQYAYLGFLTGTIVFSIASGLSEVLLSPLIAAIPSENPDRDMSRLHSLYAYGVVGVVLISTLYFQLFGMENWMYLAIFFGILPIFSSISYFLAPLPEISVTHSAGSATGRNRNGLLLCALCIFLGSAAENTMTNWISGYIENVLHISKTTGDLIGMASFAVLLGLGRTLYAKYGKNISMVLLVSMAGAAICYLAAGLSPLPVLSMVMCILTGLFTSILWPGSLILMEEHFPNPGVTAYAMMAAGGDFGGSIAPQMMGIVVDTVAASTWAKNVSLQFSLTPDQLGMKVGMLISAIFPLLGVFLLIWMRRYFKKSN